MLMKKIYVKCFKYNCMLTVTNCADLILNGARRDGEYLVYAGGHSVKVTCKLSVSGGGWTVSI